MAGEVEALGALTTAGLAAHAIDPPPHAAADHAAHGRCANCDTVLVGEYCHACGQVGHVHRSVGHIVEEFLHGLYHFDSKAWRTLPLLAFRPGRLTWDYVHGKRARFIAPLALFLLSVFLMFFVFGFVGGPDINNLADTASERTEALSDARSAVADAQGELRGAEADLTGADRDPDTTPAERRALVKALGTNRATLAAAEVALAKAAAPAAKVAGKPLRWQDRVRDLANDPKTDIDVGSPAIEERIREAMRNPDFALYRIQQKAYKLSFLLVPLSLPVLWLMFFWRRDVRTFDHVVFALYSLSFMSILTVVAVLLAKVDPTAGAHSNVGRGSSISSGISGFLFFVPPVHMFFQLKGGYRLSTFGALWRSFVLANASVVILALFAVGIVVVGLAD